MNIKFNKYLFFYILFCFFISIVKSQEWPIDQNDDNNNWDNISCTFGEIHSTGNDHYHKGVDIDVGNLNVPARTPPAAARVLSCGTHINKKP